MDRWRIQFTPEAERWYRGLSREDKHRMAAALNRLGQKGPALGRPFADSIKGSRHRNMKEMRSTGGHLRALFAFDPRRRAVVLVGGDKRNDWNGWYQRSIPRADRLYDQYLRRLGKESPWQRTGTRSRARTR